MVAKSCFFYVQEIGYFKTKQNYFAERANLNSYLIIITLKGKGILKYRGKSYILQKNQVFFIDCMEHHYYETDNNDLWEFEWLHFNGATSRGYYDQYINNNSPVTTLKNDSELSFNLQKLLEIHKQRSLRVEQISSKLIVDILTELLLIMNTQDHWDYYMPDYIHKIMKYIDKHFNERICLEQLSKEFSVSKYHMAKEFKKYTGFSPNEYIITSRITYAKNLLQYSTLSIGEISEIIGINNVSHFINLFKSRESLTPLAFRNNCQESKRS
ncbi:helix-turn-helix domain-containing protein [Clostridium grantii]|uniref:AraC-type DNA-binding protein n=1 Tax=Clostridium grantii DSM 8605 TaxID=1121316 RepID=A0A1M5SWJ9_9CLOT|nr:AraC family transcriptional regulator [Clostridium grantii]SHH42770.1 AraC-type DNA-binding protein [Clostridium grantii DSM 8605]